MLSCKPFYRCIFSKSQVTHIFTEVLFHLLWNAPADSKGQDPPFPSWLRGSAVQSCSLHSWDDQPVLTTIIACTGQQLNMQSSERHFCGENAIFFLLIWHCQLPGISVLAQGKAFPCFGGRATLPASKTSKSQVLGLLPDTGAVMLPAEKAARSVYTNSQLLYCFQCIDWKRRRREAG